MTVNRRILVLGAGLALIPVLNGTSWDSGSIGFAAHAAEEAPAAILATQVRMQGHACDKPLSAVRDAKRSKPDQSVWVLKCANAAYRMSLIPDRAAIVERLGQRASEGR